MPAISTLSAESLEGTFRLDPEYYQPEYRRMESRLLKAGAKQIDSFADVTDGIHASPEWVEENGVLYLSAKCVKDNFFVLSDAGQISQRQDRTNPRTRARTNDILLTTVGTIGNAAVVPQGFGAANMDRHLGIIRIRRNSDVDPYYLSAFLNSRYGRFQTLREATGNVQLNLFIQKIKRLKVPVGEQFQKAGLRVRQAYKLHDDAHRTYAEAEEALQRAIGLLNLDLEWHRSYNRRFAETTEACRFDAEYFQPRFQFVLSRLRDGGKHLADVADLMRRRFKPGRRAFQYLEIGSLTADGFAVSEEVLGPEAPSRAQWIVQPGDVITSTVRPIRRLSALIEPDQAGFVCSSGFAVLRPTALPAEVLLVFLKIPIVAETLDLFTTASMYPAISTTALMGFPFPRLNDRSVQAVERLVKTSRAMIRESRQLLDQAKLEIESLIERPHR